MRVVYTDEALSDVEAIAEWLATHYPTVAPAVETHPQRRGAHRAISAKLAPLRRPVRRSRSAADDIPT
jgi:plasmid stabilization system protein ParE